MSKLQSGDKCCFSCFTWTITLKIYMFWGSVSLIFMFIHYNDHTYHPLAMWLWRTVNYFLQTTQYRAWNMVSTLVLEFSVSWAFRIIYLLISIHFSSAFRVPNTMFRNSSVTFTVNNIRILPFNKYCHCLVIQQTLLWHPPQGKKRLLAEGAALQLMLYSRCIGQNSNSICVFHFAHYDTIIF